MVAEIVTFRVRHGGPLAQYTKAHPHLQLAVWCNLNYDVYELTGAQPSDADELATTLGHDAEIHRGDAGQTVILRCSSVAHNVVARECYAARCLHVAPATHNDGWEYATLISFDEESTRDAFRRLKTAGHEIELVSKRPAPGHPLLQQGGPVVGVLLERLTDRQAEAVLLAHRHGHYTSPRETTAAAIATSLGLSRSTFEEHLRKAENGLVNGIVPYLELELRTRRLKAGQ